MYFGAMAETTRDLLVEEMQELHDAEKQLVKALPKKWSKPPPTKNSARLLEAIWNRLRAK